WLFLSLLAFNFSKIVASFRVKHFYEGSGVFLSNTYNIKLHYLGMFYNLFLPGSIGGDGYKVYLLKKNHEVKAKHLISGILLDRLNGLAILFLLTCVFVFFSTFTEKISHLNLIVIAGGILVLPIFYIFCKILFPVFNNKFFIALHLSLWVQLLQVVCAICLLFSLGIFENLMDYLTLFEVSSVVAVLPFTAGGVGARELVFLYGTQYLSINEASAVAFTLLYFGLTAITALIGLLFSYNIEAVRKVNNEAQG
ncbi:MAG: lysylphosphatidylglycerol synthase transmembrane domain-containing protein, partial [Bacteroidota bacterium]